MAHISQSRQSVSVFPSTPAGGTGLADLAVPHATPRGAQAILRYARAAAVVGAFVPALASGKLDDGQTKLIYDNIGAAGQFVDPRDYFSGGNWPLTLDRQDVDGTGPQTGFDAPTMYAISLNLPDGANLKSASFNVTGAGALEENADFIFSLTPGLTRSMPNSFNNSKGPQSAEDLNSAIRSNSFSSLSFFDRPETRVIEGPVGSEPGSFVTLNFDFDEVRLRDGTVSNILQNLHFDPQDRYVLQWAKVASGWADQAAPMRFNHSLSPEGKFDGFDAFSSVPATKWAASVTARIPESEVGVTSTIVGGTIAFVASRKRRNQSAA